MQDKLKKIVAEIDVALLNNGYIFKNREDFCELRTDWNRLAEISEDFYYLLKSIKSELEK